MLAKAATDNDLVLALNPEIVGFGWGKMSQMLRRFTKSCDNTS